MKKDEHAELVARAMCKAEAPAEFDSGYTRGFVNSNWRTYIPMAEVAIKSIASQPDYKEITYKMMDTLHILNGGLLCSESTSHVNHAYLKELQEVVRETIFECENALVASGGGE